MSTMDCFGDRMKEYEDTYRQRLHPNMAVIVRLDGKAFHSYVNAFDKPFSNTISWAFETAVQRMFEELPIKAAYSQSDEVSLYLYPPDNRTYHNIPFAGNIQKLASVTASMLTYYFNKGMGPHFSHKAAFFDSRVFTLPGEEVNNYFKWRWFDCQRNAINQYARQIFSHKELQKVSHKHLLKRLENPDKEILSRLEPTYLEKWSDMSDIFKYGIAYSKRPSTKRVTYIDKRTQETLIKDVESFVVSSYPALTSPEFYVPEDCK